MLALAVGGCAGGGVVRRARPWLEEPGRAAMAATNGHNASMIYVARTDAGVLVVDLGWSGARDTLQSALTRIGATPADVRFVLLTHAHRDHIGAWRAVSGATFVIGAAEVDRLVSRTLPRGPIARLAEVLRPMRGPRVGRLAVRTLGGDTAFVVGADTVRAFALPGHTVGSVAYLFRGVLFVGDGASHRRGGALRPARAGYSDDAGLARRSLARVLDAVPPGAVRVVCTAHARCAAYTEEVRRAVTGMRRP